MSAARITIVAARDLVAELPCSAEAEAYRANVLGALDDLWDDLVLAEETTGPAGETGARVETDLERFDGLKAQLVAAGKVA